jgi:hypothetical protein
MEQTKIRLNRTTSTDKPSRATSQTGERRLLRFKEFLKTRPDLASPKPQRKSLAERTQSRKLTEAVGERNPGDSLYAYIPAGSPDRRQTADYLAVSVLDFAESSDVVVMAIALTPGSRD